ncbi:MAG: hypothetical protein JO083_05720 [Candidatus Eremiobacteraeota bacterium]|nr:hypothetical protein [Candidatus Eremiobacteraeota bacterium]
MPVPQHPPLNGRNIAEFYVASETAKRSTLRDYAKPPELQQARIIMYDPVRRILAEYFGGGREAAVLDRTVSLVEQPRFESAAYYETWRKSNRAALEHLRDLELGGVFEDVRTVKTTIAVGALMVNSTTDFYATFIPRAPNAKRRCVAVIINPSGIKTSNLEKRKTWVDIEAEVARRAATESGIEIDEVIYVDLPRQDIYRLRGPKARVWAEIDATCERIFRDWRDIRLERRRDEPGTA